MDIIKTHFEGLLVLTPRVYKDHRGYFYESFNEMQLVNAGVHKKFVQDNEASSKYGVIRGLHYQLSPAAQAKLVRVVYGEILDVVVDLRPDSKTFGMHFSLIMNDINKKQLYIPEGFAHGYSVLSDTAVFAYKCSHFYDPVLEGGIYFQDPELNIDWIIPKEEQIMSEKDKSLPLWSKHKKWKQ
ncbi:MAG TPA: dTDP-4-dehydrorhamnose 3,5-epimerase [Saprospiraceae bacterium]|nr:dTDP-4-dehydrorhamnose 3,5-epimerase [Saprospiraceae bacterium]